MKFVAHAFYRLNILLPYFLTNPTNVNVYCTFPDDDFVSPNFLQNLLTRDHLSGKLNQKGK